MHTSTLESRFHDKFVGTLNHARTNWPASGAKGRILHLNLAHAQILELFCHVGIGAVGAKGFQMPQDALRPLLLESMQDAPSPRLRNIMTSRLNRLPDGMNVTRPAR